MKQETVSTVEPNAASSAKARNFFIWFIVFSLISVSIVALITYIVDPLQFYRKPSWYVPQYSMEQRYQNPGLARNYDYDTIIIGSSMTENFVPSYVDEVLGGKSIKLSMSGSYSHEHHLISEAAFRTGQVKNVIWGLDYFSVKGGETMVRDDQGPFPYYLYDKNPLNDIKYLFNYTTITQTINILKGKLQGSLTLRNLDYLNNWDYYAVYGTESVLKDLKRAEAVEPSYVKTEEDFEEIKKAFDANILSLVKEHPETEFIFYYPPYHVLRHYVWYELNPKRYNNQQQFKQYVWDTLSEYPNAKIFDFQAVEEVTFDSNNYKDLSHHTLEINEWIIQSMANGDHQVTDETIGKMISDLDKQVENLDISQFDTDSIQIVYQGENVPAGANPVAQEDALYIPIKALVILKGAALGWEEETKSSLVEWNDGIVKLKQGSTEMKVNGETVQLSQPAQIIDGSMMIPIEALSYFGLQGEWQQGNQQVLITELVQ
ncbi:copper amine oxidase N-terminal domain-containing protein [Marinicrinis lubricantis]|uniref:Copper amine oxidase N-terminal domain-containing protein n=1 Tax=Marinicrinis lubricantis TaxID=2086470 RepID=A0ABW1IMD4_9BACL